MKMNEVPNPFVGLRPYEADESLLFFGRRQLIAELLRRLKDLRFLAVVGSSGCGKSSLVRAGLIPVLQAGFLVDDRDVWLLGTMKPGDAPLTNLATCVLGCVAERPDAVTAQETQALLDAIHESGAAAVEYALEGALARRDANLLLLVDQFEEIFRFATEFAASHQRDEAADFISILIELAAQRSLAIYVVITMRSDFIGDCDAFSGLPEVLNRGQYLVPRLTREERRDAIEGPVRLYRQEIASRLTDRLLNETIDTRDDLPVLQHALLRTWDEWCRTAQGPVDVDHYDRIGTIQQALSRDADAALEGMSERERLLTRRLFQALTTVDESNRGVRRPAKVHAVAARCEAETAEIWAIIERFRRGGRSFLVVSSERLEVDPMIDISHESLIRQWKVLGDWVADEVESVRTYRRLAETARLHRAGKSGLYRDPDLQTALDWQAAESPNAAWAPDSREDFASATAFLAESKAARDVWMAEKEFDRRWNRLRTVVAAFVLLLFFSSFGVPRVEAVWARWAAFFSSTVTSGAESLAKNQSNAGRAVGAVDIQHVATLANAVAEASKFGAHVLLYFVLTFAAKGPYRRHAFKAIRQAAARDATPPLRLRLTARSMVSKLKTGAPRVIESIAKWICIVAGVLVLGTCSALGVSEGGGTGVYEAVIGIAACAVLIGWVFAVARLNAEMKLLRSRLGPNLEQPAGAPAPGLPVTGKATDGRSS